MMRDNNTEKQSFECETEKKREEKGGKRENREREREREREKASESIYEDGMDVRGPSGRARGQRLPFSPQSPRCRKTPTPPYQIQLTRFYRPHVWGENCEPVVWS